MNLIKPRTAFHICFRCLHCNCRNGACGLYSAVRAVSGHQHCVAAVAAVGFSRTCMADTRKQILLTIKEQAQLLREPIEPLGNGATQHRWSAQQWWEAFTFLVGRPPQRLRRSILCLYCHNHASQPQSSCTQHVHCLPVRFVLDVLLHAVCESLDSSPPSTPRRPSLLCSPQAPISELPSGVCQAQGEATARGLAADWQGLWQC